MAQLKETFQLARFVARLCMAIEAAKADGKINLRDVGHLLPVLPTILPAFEDIEDVMEELLHVTDEQQAQFEQLFADEFDLEMNDKTRQIAMAALHTGAGIATLVTRFKTLKAQANDV